MVATQLTVTIIGGGPYGLRLSAGDNQAIFVDKLRKSGKADEAGLREGDMVVSVNGRDCKGFDPSTVSQWIDNAGQKVTLQVIRGNSDSSSFMTPSQDKSHVTVSVSQAQPDQLPPSAHSEFKITAPSGVDVQRNSDKSFTVTIGMPFQVDLGQSRGGSKPVAEEKFNSQHSITIDNYHRTKDAQNQQQQSKEPPLPSPSSSPAKEASPPRPVHPKQLQKILSEGSESEPNTPPSDGAPRTGKKLFVDSAFYDDPEHKYPTVEEQIQLARKVAFSVISPANLKSKGHKMFMRRKERAIRWTTGLTDEEKAELAAQVAAAKEAKAKGGPPDDEEYNGGGTSQGPQSASLSLPSSVIFAPKLPKDKDAERLNAMSHEELERMTLLERKATHTNVSPQVCFSLVDDLKSMKGKGGKLFAKRQARVEKLSAEKSEGDDGDQEEGEDVEEYAEPDPRLADKIKAEHRSRSSANFTSGSTSSASVNRLKDMIETQKAAMTPWDAAAKYGSVEKAFEHLGSAPGRQRPGQESLIETLNPQQQRRREGGRGASEAVRPKSTIGGVGMGRMGHEEALSPEEQRSKVEAIGGNPNAADLASAMTTSLAARGGLRSGGGRLNSRSKPGETGTLNA